MHVQNQFSIVYILPRSTKGFWIDEVVGKEVVKTDEFSQNWGEQTINQHYKHILGVTTSFQ